MTDPICFYHSADFDGICSGAICKKFVPNVELVGYDYGQSFPWHKVEGREVYMIDVSLKRPEMEKLQALAKEFVWIDHHKTAIDDCEDLLLLGLQVVEREGRKISACELAWEFFSDGREMPLAVHFLGRYDVWAHDEEPGALPFQYGARLNITEGVESPVWETLLHPNRALAEGLVDAIFEAGQAILRYQQQENAKYARAMAFEANFEGLGRVICLNKAMANSTAFEGVYDPEKHKAMVLFRMMLDGNWKFSLYSTHDDVDCGAICKRLFDGGGHKGAAGFTVPGDEHVLGLGFLEFDSQ